MKTSEQFHQPYDEEGAKLRILVTNKILTGLLDHLDPADLEPAELCKLAHTFCEIRKQDAACDKNIVAIEVAKIKTTAAAQTKNQGPHYDEDEEAPYGRKPDGTPHTRAEFLRDLKRSVQDIYGFTEEQATTLIDGPQTAQKAALDKSAPFQSPRMAIRGNQSNPSTQATAGAKQSTPPWPTGITGNLPTKHQPLPIKHSPDRGERFQPTAQAVGNRAQPQQKAPTGAKQSTAAPPDQSPDRKGAVGVQPCRKPTDQSSPSGPCDRRG